MYAEVQAMSDSMTLANWLRIDIRPFKQVMSNMIKKWTMLFLDHLQVCASVVFWLVVPLMYL